MKNRKLLLLAFSSIAVCAANTAHAVTYNAVNLGFHMDANALNDLGQVAGYKIGNGSNYAYVTGANGVGVTMIGTTYISSIAYGVNNSGQVTGYAYPTKDTYHAFTTGPTGSGLNDLGTLGGNYSVANGVNDAGQVSGYSYMADGTRRAFITGPGGVGVTTIGTLGGASSVAYGINNSGQVVGFSYITPGSSNIHAFITGPNGVGMTDLGSLYGGLYSQARGVNDKGQVVGFSVDADGTTTHAFMTGINATGMFDLGTLGGTRSRALGVNEAGQVVGFSTTTGGQQRAFVTSAGGAGMTDLNTLLAIALLNGDYLTSALAINEKGQIVAQSTQGYSFLLTPVPLPASAWLMFSALGGLGALKRRRR